MKLKKNKFYRNKTPIFLKDVGIKEVSVSNKMVNKTVNTLLVTCIILIKLNHYIQCFLK